VLVAHRVGMRADEPVLQQRDPFNDSPGPLHSPGAPPWSG
jgi:hypothetical protein